MSAVETIFPEADKTPPAVEPLQVIETVGVEIVEDWQTTHAHAQKTPANANHLIPFASTLRRVG